MIKIINYGLGNIDAFYNIYKRLGIDVGIASSKNDIKNAEKLILPGVGAFDFAMKSLNESGLRDEIEKRVLLNRVPIIGICIGMQIMAKKSEEGVSEGLGWIDAQVIKFNSDNLIVPEMGWNSIDFQDSPLFKELPDNPRFYFLHSYYMKCNKKENVIGTSNYGITFDSAVCEKNIFGIQFHPEKSHTNGIQLLKNFAEM